MRDRVIVAVENAGERNPVIPGDDSLVKNFASGQIRVQVDVGGQNEVLVVIFESLAEGN